MKNYNILTRNQYSEVIKLVGYAFNLSYRRDPNSPETDILLQSYRNLCRKVPAKVRVLTSFKNAYKSTKGVI